MGGSVEVDEAFLGGATRFMHKSRRDRYKGQSKSMMNKTPVMGLLERGDKAKKKSSRVTLAVVPNVSGHILQGMVRNHVESGSAVYSDAYGPYRALKADYAHAFVDHARYYVRGAVHTNGIENFWSLLKRTIKGTYVSVDPWHLFRYLDEQAYRFNNRTLNDAGRFVQAAASIIGRRLTYAELTGKGLQTA
jgi:ISXO2-like transposase domain